MDKTILTQLVHLGLTEKEAGLYLTLVRLEQASVQHIAKESGINRSTAYLLLQELEKKGFVQESLLGDARSYLPRSPQELLAVAEASVDNAEQVYHTAREAVQELEKHTSTSHRSARTTFFDTKEGLRAVAQEVASAVGKTAVRGFVHDASALPNGVPGAHSLRIVSPKTRSNSERSDHVRYIPAETYPFLSDLFLFDDIIVLISGTELFAVRIESKEFSGLVQELFDLAWGEAGRLNNSMLAAARSQKRSGAKR